MFVYYSCTLFILNLSTLTCWHACSHRHQTNSIRWTHFQRSCCASSRRITVMMWRMWWIGRSSRLSDSQQYAIVTPLPKRPGVETTDLTNYRPVSNVTFTSKIVEWSMPLPSNFISTWRKNDLLSRHESAVNGHIACLVLYVLRVLLHNKWLRSLGLHAAWSLDGVRLRRPPLS